MLEEGEAGTTFTVTRDTVNFLLKKIFETDYQEGSWKEHLVSCLTVAMATSSLLI